MPFGDHVLGLLSLSVQISDEAIAVVGRAVVFSDRVIAFSRRSVAAVGGRTTLSRLRGLI